MTNFTAVGAVLRNNYWSHNLIGPYRFWVISPRNSTLFTRPFLAGRRAWAGHETSENPGHCASMIILYYCVNVWSSQPNICLPCNCHMEKWHTVCTWTWSPQDVWTPYYFLCLRDARTWTQQYTYHDDSIVERLSLNNSSLLQVRGVAKKLLEAFLNCKLDNQHL